ncbi:hypothetical protein MOO45_00335 [Bombilactobacillus folatiphilus]|uniref:Uncharacterized protein n=1 Tax=Bombilactobacillus folatiphilus TaxID=2923362 RepID=A0ABY4P989_9LACO|nr:hypothetical protein [Bombilactobacillus folatiphilus]UQS82181.1 hypothetical protein MOO45_00335 [Bombilactobacillus folatiphilus]
MIRKFNEAADSKGAALGESVTTDISKDWWNSQDQQVNGPMLDLRTLTTTPEKRAYNATINWSLTNSLL